jgi:single-stranded-DNA-specific exonuclease
MSYSWNLLHKSKIENISELEEILLKNREITDTEKFLNPTPPNELLNENPQLKEKFTEAKKIILEAIAAELPIIIHGDYDVDGQTATAILWRTIYNDLNYKNVFPYIPNRFDEGYGVSKESLSGIRKLLTEKKFAEDCEALLITVDCGITSNKEIAAARENNFQIILTDHHHASENLPDANVVVHTDKATGAGISWLLANQLFETEDKYLELAALGTICDLQPLVGINRSIAKFGIVKLNNSDLPFIQAIKESAEITTRLDTYEIGWVIGPRLNATGRLESAMDSLRLLCTDSLEQAKILASQLTEINKTRQNQTEANLQNALSEFKDVEKSAMPNFIVTSHENYHEGVIGLVAGKLVQIYYRPAIAISLGKDGKSKGSARSIKGVSIVETLKKLSYLFTNVGGHDMAAGFSIETENIEKLKDELAKVEIENMEKVFTKQIDIDCEISNNLLSFDTFDEIQNLKPFGMGNPEPVFLISGLKIFNISIFGKENSHIKYFVTDENGEEFTALAFSRRDLHELANVGDKIDVVATLSKNVWNGKTSLELKVKDVKLV